MSGIKAVIFDMDGVLADTEPLWRIAMIEGFSQAGIEFTEDDCKTTTGMRLDEVVKHWSLKRAFRDRTVQQVNDAIIDRLCELISHRAEEMKGVTETLSICRDMNFATGLATSSASRIINAVLEKIKKREHFSSIESAEHLPFGKPHPQVFLNCADALKISPANCLVIEDSVNGIIAAKAAHMRALAVPDPYHFDDPRFAIANFKLPDLTHFPAFIKNLTSEIHASA